MNKRMEQSCLAENGQMLVRPGELFYLWVFQKESFLSCYPAPRAEE